MWSSNTLYEVSYPVVKAQCLTNIVWILTLQNVLPTPCVSNEMFSANMLDITTHQIRLFHSIEKLYKLHRMEGTQLITQLIFHHIMQIKGNQNLKYCHSGQILKNSKSPNIVWCSFSIFLLERHMARGSCTANEIHHFVSSLLDLSWSKIWSSVSLTTLCATSAVVLFFWLICVAGTAV